MAAEPDSSQVILQRTVKELLDGNVPYSDMTEDEIASIIEYKVDIKLHEEESMVRQNAYIEREAISIANTKLINQEMLDYNKSLIERLTKKVG